MCNVLHQLRERRTPSAHAAILTTTMPFSQCSMATATATAIRGQQLDKGDDVMTMGGQPHKIARALHHPCYHCIVVLIALTSLPSCCIGVITIIAPVLLPPLTWHVCAVALVLAPLSHWHCCPWCAGIIALIAQASLPLLCLHCAVNLQASSPLLSWHVLSHGRHGRLQCRQWQHQRNKVDHPSATRAVMPAQ